MLKMGLIVIGSYRVSHSRLSYPDNCADVDFSDFGRLDTAAFGFAPDAIFGQPDNLAKRAVTVSSLAAAIGLGIVSWFMLVYSRTNVARFQASTFIPLIHDVRPITLIFLLYGADFSYGRLLLLFLLLPLIPHAPLLAHHLRLWSHRLPRLYGISGMERSGTHHASRRRDSSQFAGDCVWRALLFWRSYEGVQDGGEGWEEGWWLGKGNW